MKRKAQLAALMVCLAGVLVAANIESHHMPVAQAQTGGAYDLSWNSIDGGGITFATGGAYALGGTIGQPDAGTLSGGSYTLLGGFWGAANTAGSLYLPLIVR